MAESLFLNKTKVDIFEGTISRRLQIGDIGDISSRKSSYSYTIKLPTTSINKAFFDMLGVEGNQSRKPFELVVADYVIDGVFIVYNGSAAIRKTSGNYELNLLNGIIDISEALGNKKLVDLPLADLNHILTSQKIVDSWANTDGYIYGIANFGRGVDAQLKAERMAPSIFVHTLFRRIFESNGLAFSGDFFTTNSKYLNEVLTPSKGYEVLPVTNTIENKGSATSDTVNSDEDSESPFTFSYPFTLTDVDITDASIVSGEIVFSASGSYTFNLNIDYSNTYSILNVGVYLNDVLQVLISIPEGTLETLIQEVTLEVESGDVVRFTAEGSAGENGLQYSTLFSVQFDLDLSLEYGGQMVRPSDYLGDVTQIAFVKDVIKKFGLMLHPITGSNVFKFLQIENILNDVSSAEDWSEKLVEVDSESYVSGYAKNNALAYSYDENADSIDASLVVDNENAKEEGTFIKSAFYIPAKSKLVNSIRTYLIPIWGAEYTDNIKIPTELTPDSVTNNYQLQTDGASYSLVAKTGWYVAEYTFSAGTYQNFLITGSIEDLFSWAAIQIGSVDQILTGFGEVGTGELIDYVEQDWIVYSGAVKVMVSGRNDNYPKLYSYTEDPVSVADNQTTPSKIMSLNKKTGFYSVDMFEEASPVEYYGSVPFLGLKDVDMAVYLEENFQAFSSLVNNYRKVKMKLNLSLIDIYNLDFFKLKYFRQKGRYYYLNNVLNKAGEISQAELIEIQEFNNPF